MRGGRERRPLTLYPETLLPRDSCEQWCFTKEVLKRMTTIMRYDPFREALSLRKAIDQLFEQSFVNPGWVAGNTQATTVPMNICETEQGYRVYCLLPGVKPENLELTIQENNLLLKGDLQPFMKPDEKVNWLTQEFGFGHFERSVTFPRPIDADKIETSYEHGVLMIWLP